MISVRCECGKAYAAEEKHAGKKMRCRHCGWEFIIPTAVPKPAAPKPAATDPVMAEVAPSYPVAQPAAAAPQYPVSQQPYPVAQPHAAAPVMAGPANSGDPFAMFPSAPPRSSAAAKAPPAASSKKKPLIKGMQGVPGWAWVFVIACGILPVLTLGGAVPIGVALLGIGAIQGAARHKTMSTLAKVGTCFAITAGCWLAVGLLVVFVAFAMAPQAPNAKHRGGNVSPPAANTTRNSMSPQKVAKSSSSPQPAKSKPNTFNPPANGPMPSLPELPQFSAQPNVSPASSPPAFQPPAFQPPAPAPKPAPPAAPVAISSVATALSALAEPGGHRTNEAAKWLASAPRESASADEAKQITTAMFPLAKGNNGGMRELATTVFCRFAGPSDVPKIEAILSLPLEYFVCWGPALNGLIQLDPQRASRILEARIDDFHFRARTAPHLAKLTTSYEEVVWPLLKSPNPKIRDHALYMLGDTGTAKSIGPINQAVKSSNEKDLYYLKPHAEDAIKKIRQRAG